MDKQGPIKNAQYTRNSLSPDPVARKKLMEDKKLRNTSVI